MVTTSRNEDRGTRPGDVSNGSGFPSDRPVSTSRPSEQQVRESTPDPAVEADRLISQRLNGDGDGRHPGDADPLAESASLIPNHRQPAPATVGSGALLSTSADDAYRWRAAVEKLERRPAWHGVLTPATVAEAWQALTAALQAAQAEHHAVHGVNVAEAAHGKAEAEAHRTAAREGHEPPRAKPVPNWDAQRAQHRARAAGLLDCARTARGAYDQAITVALPDWRAELAAQVQPQHVKAANALGSALQAYGGLVGVIEAVRAQGAAEGEEWRPLPQFDAGRQGITKALDALAKLDSSKPLTAPRLTPSRAERQAIAQMGDLHAMHSLRRVEQREGYAFTSHTKGVLLEQAPPGMDN